MGMALVAQASFESISTLADAWTQMEARSGEAARTEIEVASFSHQSAIVSLSIKNAGETLLRDFESWDVVAQYYEANGDYHQLRVPYAGFPPGNNQWAVEGIYLDAGGATPEVFQPGIVDPTEHLMVQVKLNPPYVNDGRNQLVIGTPNGVTTSTMF